MEETGDRTRRVNAAQTRLDRVLKTDPRLWRAYLLKEDCVCVRLRARTAKTRSTGGSSGRGGSRIHAVRDAPTLRIVNQPIEIDVLRLDPDSRKGTHRIDEPQDHGSSPASRSESTDTNPLSASRWLALGSHPPQLPWPQLNQRKTEGDTVYCAYSARREGVGGTGPWSMCVGRIGWGTSSRGCESSCPDCRCLDPGSRSRRVELIATHHVIAHRAPQSWLWNQGPVRNEGPLSTDHGTTAACILQRDALVPVRASDKHRPGSEVALQHGQ